MTITMLLLLSVLPGTAVGAGVTLALSTSTAPVGGSITASGTAAPDAWVSIKLLDSAQNIVLFDAVKADAQGSYSCIFKVPYVSAGVLDVIAGYGSNVAHQTLTVSAQQSGGSSGGGGSSATSTPVVTNTGGSASISPGTGGTVSLGDAAAVEIPANALQESSALEVKVEKISSPPTVPAGSKLASEVFEFSIGGRSQYSFSKTVTVKFAFNSSLLGENETPSVHYYDEAQSAWVNIGGTVSGSTISAQVDHFTKFAVLGVTKSMGDKPVTSLTDIAGNWAEVNIKKLVALGSIGGYPDGRFKPDSPITRAEFATVLVKTFNLPAQEGKGFADTADHWSKDYISAATANRIVNGYSDTQFGPDDFITREQMAVMIVNTAKLNTVTEGKSFTDQNQISPWAQKAVATASSNSIITGYPDGSFNPQGNATRAEAVTVIAKTL